MHQYTVKLTLLILIMSQASSCSTVLNSKNPNQEQNGASTQSPQQDSTSVEGVGSHGKKENVNNVEEIEITVGTPKGIETLIEGMKETVLVTPYTIEPHHISYHLRTWMGEPTIEENIVRYVPQKGYIIQVHVFEDAGLKETIEKMQGQYHAAGYDIGEVKSTLPEQNVLQGKFETFLGEDHFAGYRIYAFGEGGNNTFVVEYRYPHEASDGMYAVLEEMFSSLKVE